MNQPPLQAATRDFVSVLDDVIAGAIDTDVRFGANLTGDGRRAWIEASRMGVRTGGFPLVRADDDPTAPALLLDASRKQRQELRTLKAVTRDSVPSSRLKPANGGAVSWR